MAEVGQWAHTQRLKAIAQLNDDKAFWQHLHRMNSGLESKGLPQKKMPNLGMLSSKRYGTFTYLDQLLHDRIIEFIIILKGPNSHPDHWEERHHYLRILLNYNTQLENIMFNKLKQKPERENTTKGAFEQAWDQYVLQYCTPIEENVKFSYPPNYPACEAEDTCTICETSWQQSPNAVRLRDKCECCEFETSQFHLPGIPIFKPNPQDGSQDEYLNKHLWSLNTEVSKLPECLKPSPQ